MNEIIISPEFYYFFYLLVQCQNDINTDKHSSIYNYFYDQEFSIWTCWCFLTKKKNQQKSKQKGTGEEEWGKVFSKKSKNAKENREKKLWKEKINIYKFSAWSISQNHYSYIWSLKYWFWELFHVENFSAPLHTERRERVKNKRHTQGQSCGFKETIRKRMNVRQHLESFQNYSS